MSIENTETKTGESILLRIDQCRKAIWQDKESRPSLRTFKEWKRLGYFPQVKIGRTVYLDPNEVQLAIRKRFTINAKKL